MIMNKYVAKYKNLLLDCNKEYNKIKNNIACDKHEDILYFLHFMLNYPTGIYSSYLLERYYLNIAEEIKVELSEEYDKGSVLHIMTEAYERGGHTRVVERWIGFADLAEKHSVFFTTSTTKNVPSLLEKEVLSRNGEIVQLPINMPIQEKGKKLREYASKYEKIVLHVHNFDAIPLIAFGTNEFKRPIIFSNHSDHLFWLGVSITDICLNYRKYGDKINTDKRHIKNNFITGLPFIVDDYGLEGENFSKNDLGLPDNCKIVLTYATSYKYKPISDLNIANVMKEIFKRNTNVIFMIIGVNNEIKEITEVKKLYGDRLLLKEGVSHKELLKYIKLSDVVIDSFPVAGGTSMLDALYLNKPVLSVYSLIGQQDYIMDSDAYCNSVDDLINKLMDLLSSSDECSKNIETLKKNALKYNTKEVFCKNINELYKRLPKHHSVHRFDTDDTTEDFIDCDVLQLFMYIKKSTIFKLSSYLELIKIKQYDSTVYTLTIFGKNIFTIKLKKNKWKGYSDYEKNVS